jgi:hypothetical protein
MKLPPIGMDRYDRNARLRPALIVFMPIALTVVALAADSLANWSGAVAVVIQAGGAYILAQTIGDIGKKKEPALFKRFGGRPTDRLLSHKTAPNRALLALRHKKLQDLLPNIKIPTAATEEKNQAAAASVWAACVDLIRGKCRGNEAVMRENISYGWRRNTWAIKPAGIAAAGVCTIVVVAELGGLLYRHERINPIVPFIGGVNLAMVLWWLTVTPDWVLRAANLYAERLIEALDAL